MTITKEIIKNKLFAVNEWVVKARNEKDWATYEQAVLEYARLLKILKTL